MADELTRAKACLVRQLPLSEAGIAEIAQGMLGRTDLGLPLDEPTRAAEHYIGLDGPAVQDAFRQAGCARRTWCGSARDRRPNCAAVDQAAHRRAADVVADLEEP